MTASRIYALEQLAGANGFITDGDWIESKDQDPAGSIRLIQLADIGDGVFRNRSRRFINTETATRLRCTFLKPGDVLIARMPDPLGRACVFPDIGQQAVTAVDVCILRVDETIADATWVASYLNSPGTRSEILKLAQGATRARVPTGQLRKLELLTPTLSEQRRIAARLKAQLAAVEEARKAVNMQTREDEALWKAIYRKAFAEIVPVTVPPQLGSTPIGWQWTTLTDVARLESGHTPSRARSDWWGGNISWVSLTEIRSLDGHWTNETQIKTNDGGIANPAARVLPRGTVCYSRTASVGFVTIMAEPMATSQDFANWVCGEELAPEFLMHALIRSRNELRALATGATHKTIYMPTLKAFHICFPKRTVQERIVRTLKAQLAAAEEARKAALAQLNEIEQLPARLLAQAFKEV